MTYNTKKTVRIIVLNTYPTNKTHQARRVNRLFANLEIPSHDLLKYLWDNGNLVFEHYGSFSEYLLNGSSFILSKHQRPKVFDTNIILAYTFGKDANINEECYTNAQMIADHIGSKKTSLVRYNFSYNKEIASKLIQIIKKNLELDIPAVIEEKKIIEQPKVAEIKPIESKPTEIINYSYTREDLTVISSQLNKKGLENNIQHSSLIKNFFSDFEKKLPFLPPIEMRKAKSIIAFHLEINKDTNYESLKKALDYVNAPENNSRMRYKLQRLNGITKENGLTLVYLDKLYNLICSEKIEFKKRKSPKYEHMEILVEILNNVPNEKHIYGFILKDTLRFVGEGDVKEELRKKINDYIES